MTSSIRRRGVAAPGALVVKGTRRAETGGHQAATADEQDLLVYAAASDGPGRLLEQTEAMLQATSFRDLKVVDIAAV